jgi:hypothetical protein
MVAAQTPLLYLCIKGENKKMKKPNVDIKSSKQMGSYADVATKSANTAMNDGLHFKSYEIPQS